MRVLVINLDRAPERLKHINEIFAAAGVPFERVAAVDGKLLSPEELAKWRQGPTYFGGLSDAELACYLSHRKCWEIAAASSEPTVIFEDDVYLGRDAREALLRNDWIPDDADVVKIEKHMYPLLVDRATKSAVAGRQLLRMRGLNNGGGGYILTPRSAKRLLEAVVAIGDPFDQVLFNPRLPLFTSLAIYQLTPALSVQDCILNNFGPGMKFETSLPRHKPSRKGIDSLKRRIEAPFENAARWLKQTAINLATRRHWVTVEYE
jgi:glycosyl transferase family 25